jgi:hypothetical protein
MVAAMDAVRMNAAIAALCGVVATLACSNDARQAKPDGGGVVTPDGASPDQPVTGGVSFVNDVYPIIAASCSEASCHDMAITANHWTDYTTADKTYTRWVNGPGFDFCVDTPADGIYTSRVIVVPGDPDGSYLITKIAPPTDAPCQDPTHHRRMPPDPRPALPQTSIDTIVQWIREGALNN